MRTEYRVFAVVGAFLGLAAAGYAWWTWYALSRVEWAGTFVLGLSAGLCAICGFYFAVVARRIQPRPEDRPAAELAEGTGVVGFFSPGSYWPLGIGASAWAAAFGVVVWQWWLIAAGLAGVLATAAGLLLEYYTRSRG